MSANFKWKGTSPPIIVGVKKLECFITLQWRPHSPSFIRMGRVPACNRRTDRRTEFLWLIQRFVLQAMRPRCNDDAETVTMATV